MTARLQHGHGEEDPGIRGCIMDFAVWRLTKGTYWQDQHPCFNIIVTYAAQTVNDRLSHEGLLTLDRDFSDRIDRARRAQNHEIEARINKRLIEWTESQAPDGIDTRRPNTGAGARAAERIYAIALDECGCKWTSNFCPDTVLLAFLDELLDQWEKIAADEGALGDLWTFEEWAEHQEYRESCQANGS